MRKRILFLFALVSFVELYAADTGLVTSNRSVKKDTFYWFKANWNRKDYFTYIAGRSFTNKTKPEISIKVYSNCSAVVINVNGTPYEATNLNNHIFVIDNVTLREGENTVEAIGMHYGKGKRDKVVISYQLAK